MRDLRMDCFLGAKSTATDPPLADLRDPAAGDALWCLFFGQFALEKLERMELMERWYLWVDSCCLFTCCTHNLGWTRVRAGWPDPEPARDRYCSGPARPGGPVSDRSG
ncbi:unnamed protein product [Cuscuta europaea]|uniref:Uncharacterized protein n=1 Tax=Cuscuta europaea TaxID=41803 RepID=A0A9P0YTU6_CUSEU|nr:unnamed protein product [Cuscuta europaea]